MKAKRNKLQVLLALMILGALGLSQFATAQSPNASQKPTDNVNTNTKMLYHDGPIMSSWADVYFIWYGCWDDTCGLAGDTTTQMILTDFASSVGGSPYFQINTMYPNAAGQRPTGALFYGGAVYDRYSHGLELTASDIQGIVDDQLVNGGLPQDPIGIYVVVASADVSSNATGFCVTGAQPHHGLAASLGVSSNKYAVLGNPRRCPSVAAPQFVSGTTLLPTPNGSFAADAMATTLAHLMNVVITNPHGSAWYDRYGLENSDKCLGQFGPTYTTDNGARANLRLGQRHYLIQQNWVNDRRGHCAMNSNL